jgi:ABC-type bacteriocin/lantibiotic exporter with double-glycine peptidase domain
MSLVSLVFQLGRAVGRRRLGQLTVLTVLLLGAAACEAIGIGLVFYLVTALQNPDEFLSSRTVASAREMLAIESSHGFLALLCGVFVALFAAKAVFVLFAYWLKLKMQWSIQGDLTRTLFASYLRQPLAFHSNKNSGEVTYTLTGGVSQTTQNGYIALTELVGDVLMLLAIVGAVIVVQPLIGGAALFGGLTLVVVYGVLGQPLFARWGRNAKEIGHMAVRATVEPLVGVRAVKAAGAEMFFVDRLSVYLSNLAATQRRFMFAQALLRPALEFLIVAVLMGTLTWMFGAGGDPGPVLPILALLGAAAYRIIPALVRVATSLHSLRFAAPQIEVVCAEIERAKEQDRVAGTAKRRLRVKRRLALRGETFSHLGSAHPVLIDVDVEVAVGETIALVGRSGSGKSTLADILTGLRTPQTGQLIVDGVALATDAELDREGVGYVQQETFLMDDSIAANVTLGRRSDTVDQARLRRALTDAACDEFVASLPRGADTSIGERGTRLSGGQRQRLGIARALYSEPDVLVFDEATSSLDIPTEREIVESIRRLRERRAIIVVAHRLATIKSADRIYFFVDGRVVDVGTYSELEVRNAAFAAFSREAAAEQANGEKS